MLSSLVRIPTSEDVEEPEDIFTSALGTMFTDDAQNMHGNPGSEIIYRSQVFGDVPLKLADPVGEDGRKLFAHYLWNASILLAELMGLGCQETMMGERTGSAEGAKGPEVAWRGRYREGRLGEHDWSVKGQQVVELGAGTGLAGITAAQTGASRVCITDYPASEILTTLKTNLGRNVAPSGFSKPGFSCSYQVAGHEWGSFDDEFSMDHHHGFTRVLAADCLWMPWQHANLAQSMEHFLTAEGQLGQVWVTAGFHTGRAKVVAFFDEVKRRGVLVVDDIWEVDTDLKQRAWEPQREDDISQRKKWLVVAILKRTI